MQKSIVSLVGAAAVTAAVATIVIGSSQAGRAAASPPVRPMPAHASRGPLSSSEARAVIENYCLTCHDNDKQKGDLTLETFDPGKAEARADVGEKIIKKLRAGMMPPPGADRPPAETLDGLALALETRLDAAAEANPNPGHRTFQRLNRAEYAQAVKDILGLDVDVASFLPADTISHNFDNIADVQSMSATVLEGYLRAAAQVSRLAIGDPEASPDSTIYKIPRMASQLRHVEGAPFGTRGGISVVHNFPADGEYLFRLMLHSIPTGQLYGSAAAGRGEQIEVSINGERVAVLDINPRMSEADPNGMNMTTPPVAVKAGPQRVSAAFLVKSEAPVDDLLAPVEQTLADTQIGSGVSGVTTVPHLREFAVVGPQHVTGVSDTPTRRRVFTCRPLSASEEIPCATKILTGLATRAYRRPVNQADLDGLLGFYKGERDNGGFEAGIRTALQAMLASPHFIFRLEEASAARTGQVYRINDVDVASRLSFFLWGSVPDEELLAVAARGGLSTPAAVEQQARRMLADPRASALSQRFASQWLRLQDLDKIKPDARLYPSFDTTLADAMITETQMLFDSIVREDRDVLDLLTADYTFVNERLARHYGIPHVSGPRFRRVSLADFPERRGILGEGSILTMTSVADRTSPVQRGKWVLEVLLGTTPPPPPANVPDLAETKASAGARLLSVRERLEQHRSSPQCQSCHRVIDPLGLALENFDVVGQWRIRDGGSDVDPSGQLYDGTPLDGPIALRAALLKRKETVLRVFTENLLAYSLGRRVEAYDMPLVRRIVRDAEANQNHFSSFVLGIVKSPAFRMSRADTSTH